MQFNMISRTDEGPALKLTNGTVYISELNALQLAVFQGRPEMVEGICYYYHFGQSNPTREVEIQVSSKPVLNLTFSNILLPLAIMGKNNAVWKTLLNQNIDFTLRDFSSTICALMATNWMLGLKILLQSNAA